MAVVVTRPKRYARIQDIGMSPIVERFYTAPFQETDGCVGDWIAVFVAIVRKEGTMWFESCGHSRESVLWALVLSRIELMRD